MLCRRGFLLVLIAVGPFGAVVSHGTELPEGAGYQSIEEAQRQIADITLRQFLQPIVDALRSQTAGDTRMQNLLSQLTVTADPWSFGQGNAYADREHGARVVVETNLVRSTFSLSELDIMENGPWNYKQQAVSWWRQYGQQVREALVAGLPVPPATSPLKEYVADSLHRAFMREYSRQEYEPAIAFVVLHEIAHHVLEHVKGRPATLEKSRQRELDADRWAFQKLRELKYPLRGVYDWLREMAVLQAALVALAEGQATVPSPGLLEKIEQNSTHPLWLTRAAGLAQNFNVNLQPQLPFIFFTGMDIFTRPDGRRELFKVTIGFPNAQTAAVFGRGLLLFRESKAMIPVWAEYKDGHAYIYASGRVKIDIEAPGNLFSTMKYEVVGEQGQRRSVTLGAWYDSFAKYFASEITSGVTIFDALELGHPARALIPTINQLPWDQSARRAVVDTLNACTRRLNGILLSYHKGLVDLMEEERESLLSKHMQECQEALKSRIGEEHLKILQAKILESKTFQSAFEYFVQKGKEIGPAER